MAEVNASPRLVRRLSTPGKRSRYLEPFRHADAAPPSVDGRVNVTSRAESWARTVEIPLTIDRAVESPADVRKFHLHRAAGDWEHWSGPLTDIFAAAEDWRQQMRGIEKPWLCWNVSDRWCVLQQRLVLEAGWTPVVGFDPRSGPPRIVNGAHLVDFNRTLNAPLMYLMFPLDFIHLFCDRMAYWHADLLCRRERVAELAAVFTALKDGEMAAVFDRGGRRNLLQPSRHRFWELAGCTTAGASRAMFDVGLGWWRTLWLHPNCPNETERAARRRLSYDFGFGIMRWKRRYSGRVISIDQSPLLEGHCTSIARKDYKRISPEGDTRNLGAEIDLNYDIASVARDLGIASLLDGEG